MNKKKIIISAVVAALVIAMLVMAYVTKNREPAEDAQPEESIHITAEADDAVAGPVLDSLPEDIWAADEDTGYNGFTTRVQLGDIEDSIGVLTIEKLGVSCHVYDSDESTVMEDMKRGAAHFKVSSYWDGNVALSAHIGKLEYCYFDQLHTLVEGDIISYETTIGQRNYAVQTISRISDEDWSMIERTADNRLTLVTCVDGQPDMRLCVQAVEIVA